MLPATTTVQYARNVNVSYHRIYKVVRTSAPLGDWDTTDHNPLFFAKVSLTKS